MGWKWTVWVAALIGLASCQKNESIEYKSFEKRYNACLRIGPIIFDAHNEKDAYKGSIMRENLANYMNDNEIDIEFRNINADDIYDVYCNKIFIGRYAIAPGEVPTYKINADPFVSN